MLKFKNRMLASLSFVIIFSIFITMAGLEYQSVVNEEKASLNDELTVIKTNIEHTIISRMINANGIAGFLELNSALTNESFNIFAENMYQSVNHIVKDVVFITDTTITHIYPNYYGENAIGVDLTQVEEQREVLLYTKEMGEPVFFGPVALVEGDQGIIIRVPIRVKDKYYGQTAIVFDYEKFIDFSGISELSRHNEVVLEGEDPISGEMSQIWGNSSDVKHTFVVEKLSLEGIDWVIKAQPKNGWRGDSLLFYSILVFGFVFSFATARVYYRQLNFKTELMTTNKDMKLTVERLAESEQQLLINYTEIKEKEAYIQYLADHDPLTKLFNRRLFRENLEASLAKGKRGYVVLIDLDNFKNVNDIHGHVYGDKLLLSCTEIMREVIENKGSVYRFGGDEFLILLEEPLNDEAVTTIMAEITEKFSNQTVGTTMIHITLSSGVVRYPLDAEDVESLLIKVDLAMYSAKYAGKNQMAFFKPSLLEEFDVKIAIEEKLRQALEDDGFMMHYQPIVDIQSGEIVSFEALIRLKDFTYSPIEFITVSEDTGMIVPLGYWIVEEVVQQLKSLLDQGIRPKPIAINLSPKQLMSEGFVDRFFSILEAYAIKAHLIEVEITESVFLENEDKNIAALRALHKAGIKISLDDFGTGYSSLNYLTYLPADKVKLDKSLKDKFTQMNEPKVLMGMVAMAHGLGMQVVAEGVEMKEEWEKLRQSGCDYLQGYLFSRPVEGSEIQALLNQGYLHGTE